MKHLAEGTALLLILVMANVVAGGVFIILGPIALALPGDPAQVAATVVIGLLAVLSALLFLRGAVLCLVLSDPNKGLKSAPGRRGG